MRNIAKRLMLSAVALILVGCAQTGQELRLGPTVDVDDSSIGAGHEVAVRVVDTRDDGGLGELENRGRDPARLTSVTGLDDTLQLLLEDMLEAYGFDVIAWNDTADRRLEVQLSDISHTVSSGVIRDVHTQVELRSRAGRGDSTLTGRTTARDRDRISYRPDAEANAAYVDATLERAMQRLINDDLLAFLTEED